MKSDSLGKIKKGLQMKGPQLWSQDWMISHSPVKRFSFFSVCAPKLVLWELSAFLMQTFSFVSFKNDIAADHEALTETV